MTPAPDRRRSVLDLGGTGKLRERAIASLLFACAAASIAITVAIMAVLAGETWAFFEQVPLSAFLLDTQWTPLFADAHFGIWPLVAGTFLTTVIAMAVALPIGVLAAIYLSELAAPGARRALKPLLEVLAGVPTVVYGYFALVVLSPVLQRFVPGLAGFSALAAGLVMGLMIVPLISSLSEEALSAVPRALREAAFALGSGPIQVVTGVVLPAARPGIFAAALLGVARAVGETMIVAIAAGQQARLTLDPRVPIETLTAYIVQVSMGDTPAGTIEYRTIFAVGTSLFVMTFVINLIGHRLARRAGMPR